MGLKELQESLKALNKVFAETGEPDQQYDHGFYQKICDALNELGYEASHREFDKYQGVVITIKGVDSLNGKPMVKEMWHTEHPGEFTVGDDTVIFYENEDDIGAVVDALENEGLKPSHARDKNMTHIKKSLASMKPAMEGSIEEKKKTEDEKEGKDGKIDVSEVQEKEDEILNLLANALVVGMSEVEELLGEKFENSREAEAFLVKMMHKLQTTDRSELRMVLRRFDTMGSNFVRQYRRNLA